MRKRRQQYDIEKSLEYGGIEHMRVDPRAYAKFKAKAFEPIQLPRDDTTKEHNTRGVMQCGEYKTTE